MSVQAGKKGGKKHKKKKKKVVSFSKNKGTCIKNVCVTRKSSLRHFHIFVARKKEGEKNLNIFSLSGKIPVFVRFVQLQAIELQSGTVHVLAWLLI